MRDPSGRPPAAPAGASTLTGTVTTFGGQPAVGARVRRRGEGPTRTTTTDRAGSSPSQRCAPDATTSPSRSRDMSRSPTASGASKPQGTPVPIDDGETRDIAMQLPRGGVITGMVLDERGEPAVNAFVRVMRFMPGAAERRPQQIGGDSTDDRGIYRIHSLQPGEYAVCANLRGTWDRRTTRSGFRWRSTAPPRIDKAPSPGMRQQMATRLAELQAQLPAQSEPATGYSNVCFPGSSPTPSTMIPVGAGEERRRDRHPAADHAGRPHRGHARSARRRNPGQRPGRPGQRRRDRWRRRSIGLFRHGRAGGVLVPDPCRRDATRFSRARCQ